MTEEEFKNLKVGSRWYAPVTGNRYQVVSVNQDSATFCFFDGPNKDRYNCTYPSVKCLLPEKVCILEGKNV